MLGQIETITAARSHGLSGVVHQINVPLFNQFVQEPGITIMDGYDLPNGELAVRRNAVNDEAPPNRTNNELVQRRDGCLLFERREVEVKSELRRTRII